MNSSFIFEKLIPFLGFIAAIGIVIAAIFVEIIQQEEPCPLCLLQRVAFLAMGASLLMILKYGYKTEYWGMIILSSLSGAMVSIRQILLHITEPVGFGFPILGLHLYTWALLAFTTALIGSALVLTLAKINKN